MRVDPRRLEARSDRLLREELLGQGDVKKALQRVNERTGGFGFESRRRLLTSALRLTRPMAPTVVEALDIAREALGYQGPLELFVRPDPMLNACCMRPASGAAIIVLSSRLLEVFTPAELRFVIGHELGHLVFDHWRLPMPLTAIVEDMAGVMVSRVRALRLYHWSRAAELSADRAGLVCAQDPEAAASGFFKLASGLSSSHVRPDLEAYASQVDALVSAPAAREKPRDDDDTLGCFSTHPYSPLRVRAVVAFSRSQAYRQAIGAAAHGALSDEELESLVERDLSLMDPSYLEEKTAHSDLLRGILHAGGIVVAAANGVITDSEKEALRTLLGTEASAAPVNVEASRKDLARRCAEAKSIPLAQRAMVVQHLTLIAAADGVVEPVEVAEIERVAEMLDVGPRVIDEALHAARTPLD